MMMMMMKDVRGSAMLAVVVLLALVSAESVYAQRYGTAETVEGGYGCYDEVEHTCDCEATMDECDSTEGSFWTDLCSGKCDAPEGASVVAGCLKSASEDGSAHGGCSCSTPPDYCAEQGDIVTESCACFQGCYNQDTHECDCDTTADECSASPSSFFTSLCHAKCVDRASFMPGCLDFDEDGSHGCNCDIGEDDCKADDSDVWTDSCDCSIPPVLGCYDEESYMCDCEVSRSECNARGEGHSWSGLCTDKCVHGDNVMTGCLVFEESGRHACACDVPASTCQEDDMMMYTDACSCFPGCYDGNTNMCDCDVTAEECNATDSSFFTAMCNSKCEDPEIHAPGCLTGFMSDAITEDNTEGAHRCDCSKSEDECGAEEGIWTDACQCYVPAGCYDISVHKCDCSVSEEECLAPNTVGERPTFYWTDTCVGTSGPSCGFAEQGVRPRGDAPGCYNSTLHKCNCDLTEEQCQSTVDIVTWTESCRCPAREDALGPN